MFDLHCLLRLSTLSLAAQYNVRIRASSQNTHPIPFNPKTLPPQSHSSLQFYTFLFISFQLRYLCNEAKQAHYKTKAVWNKPAMLLNLLPCDNRLECGPDSAGTLMFIPQLRPCLKNFTTISVEKNSYLFKTRSRYPLKEKRKSKPPVRSPRKASTHKNNVQCTSTNAAILLSLVRSLSQRTKTNPWGQGSAF